MSRSKWIAAALVALVVPAVPAAQAGDRTRVQITIAPSWGWGPTYRPAYRVDRRGYHDGYRSGPVIRFDYRDRGGYFGRGGYRPGGYLRYDSRRDRDYYQGRDGRRDGRHGGRYGGR